MQRPLAPKRQVEEIDRFVRACGGAPKRSELLELVARLNGAPNWNALTARKAADTEADESPQAVSTLAGIREVDVNATRVVFVETIMFDEEAQWHFSHPVGRSSLMFERGRALTAQELVTLQREGIVMEAQMLHPNVARYGTPDEAVTPGFLRWLRQEQGLSSCDEGRFALYTEDSLDDTPATCLLTVRVPLESSLGK